MSAENVGDHLIASISGLGSVEQIDAIEQDTLARNTSGLVNLLVAVSADRQRATPRDGTRWLHECWRGPRPASCLLRCTPEGREHAEKFSAPLSITTA